MNKLPWLPFVLALALVSCAHRPPAPGREAGRIRAKHPGCEPLNVAKRQEILSIADPENYPATRYRAPA
jgi:hypothetical protein